MNVNFKNRNIHEKIQTEKIKQSFQDNNQTENKISFLLLKVSTNFD